MLAAWLTHCAQPAGRAPSGALSNDSRIVCPFGGSFLSSWRAAGFTSSSEGGGAGGFSLACLAVVDCSFLGFCAVATTGSLTERFVSFALASAGEATVLAGSVFAFVLLGGGAFVCGSGSSSQSTNTTKPTNTIKTAAQADT